MDRETAWRGRLLEQTGLIWRGLKSIQRHAGHFLKRPNYFVIHCDERNGRSDASKVIKRQTDLLKNTIIFNIYVFLVIAFKNLEYAHIH